MIRNALPVALVALSSAVAPPAGAAEPGCFPECREGYLCHEGRCIQACNPPCPGDQRCTAAGRCVSDAPATPRRSPATTRPPRRSRDGDVGAGYFGFGLGPEAGEYAGGGLDLEFGVGRPGSYFAFHVSGGGGVNWDDNPVAVGSAGLGWRGIFGGGPAHLTASFGLEVAYMVEFGSEHYISDLGEYTSFEYTYLMPWFRGAFGVLWPMGSGLWGLEAVVDVGYRVHLNADENYWGEDYSGFSGMFRARVRFLF